MKHSALFSLLVIPVFLNGQALTTYQTLRQLNTITPAVPFLLITPDARAGGIGDAGCASTPDIYSNYWNVSKNVFTNKKNGISFSFTPWLRALAPDINLLSISLYNKIGNRNVIGFYGKYMRWGEIVFYPRGGYFSPYEYSGSISFSHKIKNNFSVGVACKYIHSQLTGDIAIGNTQTQAGQSFAGDISCYWKDTIMFQEEISEFALGVSISNVGQKIKYTIDTLPGDFIPTNLRIGISYKINLNELNSLEFICDANKLLVPTPPIYDSIGNIIAGMSPDRSVLNALYTSFYDAPGGFREELNELYLASGIEGRIFNIVFLRAGYFYEHETKGGRKFLTFGIGLKYWGIGLDGSYLLPTQMHHPLKNTWRASLSWKFDGFRKKKD